MTERTLPSDTCPHCGEYLTMVPHKCELPRDKSLGELRSDDKQDVEIKPDEASEILALRQEIAEVEMTLGRYGRHDACCEGRALDKLPCRCGWNAVVVKYARKWEQALKDGA